MRLLLLSDTHGCLATINRLVDRTHADAVIHAGDFGFYDDGSYQRLSDRELRLVIVHSVLPHGEKQHILSSPRDEQVEAARQHHMLGDLPKFIGGEERFSVPVYVVWGNHEDKDVVARIHAGTLQVENLLLLHSRSAYRLERALIYGVGGNFLPGAKLMQRPIAGGSGRLWSTINEYADLLATLDNHADWRGLRICVSHVSPGKEPFIELVGVHTRADFTVSGHMGAPASMVWNSFAIRSAEEATQRLQDGLAAVQHACQEATGGPTADKFDELFRRLGELPDESVASSRGVREPRWYRGLTHVNVPDAAVGYAVLDVNDAGTKLQTCVL